MKRLNKKGFTLIELIVVIAILAILAAILIPAITGYITKATEAKDSANCRAYYSQISMQVMLDQTASPANGGTLNGLTVHFTEDSTNNVISGFYCDSATKRYSAPAFTPAAIPAP